jgi:dUTP diphosphatase
VKIRIWYEPDMAERGEVEVLAIRVGTGEAPPPAYQSAGAAGMDLPADVHEEVVIAPGKRALVGTGWSLAIPPGFEAQVRPRSGLALKHGVTVLNTPGTIDSDYRGEIKVVLANFGDEDFIVRRGDRIAQLVVAPVTRAHVRIVTSLEPTARGDGGYGSTGVRG